MKIEEKVPTLEQCKRLVELGVNTETERFWYTDEDGLNLSRYDYWMLMLPGPRYPAPDVAELGELLPNIRIERTSGLWWYYYIKPRDSIYSVRKFHTEAQARAAALIWLIENGYLTI